jgi:hypothetical protein
MKEKKKKKIRATKALLKFVIQFLLVSLNTLVLPVLALVYRSETVLFRLFFIALSLYIVRPHLQGYLDAVLQEAPHALEQKMVAKDRFTSVTQEEKDDAYISYVQSHFYSRLPKLIIEANAYLSFPLFCLMLLLLQKDQLIVSNSPAYGGLMNSAVAAAKVSTSWGKVSTPPPLLPFNGSEAMLENAYGMFGCRSSSKTHRSSSSSAAQDELNYVYYTPAPSLTAEELMQSYDSVATSLLELMTSEEMKAAFHDEDKSELFRSIIFHNYYNEEVMALQHAEKEAAKELIQRSVDMRKSIDGVWYSFPIKANHYRSLAAFLEVTLTVLWIILASIGTIFHYRFYETKDSEFSQGQSRRYQKARTLKTKRC